MVSPDLPKARSGTIHRAGVATGIVACVPRGDEDAEMVDQGDLRGRGHARSTRSPRKMANRRRTTSSCFRQGGTGRRDLGPGPAASERRGGQLPPFHIRLTFPRTAEKLTHDVTFP
jgi:hypothetical protein